MITVLRDASSDLFKTIVNVARRKPTVVIVPDQLDSYNACRLVPLEKYPGIRPIGTGEVPQRLIGRLITKCLSQDLLELGSNKHLCLRQKNSIEFAIHSFREKFEESDRSTSLTGLR